MVRQDLKRWVTGTECHNLQDQDNRAKVVVLLSGHLHHRWLHGGPKLPDQVAKVQEGANLTNQCWHKPDLHERVPWLIPLLVPSNGHSEHDLTLFSLIQAPHQVWQQGKRRIFHCQHSRSRYPLWLMPCHWVPIFWPGRSYKQWWCDASTNHEIEL